ncbi:hypothetical protein RFI_09492 [Reticulomyxa filosa]|uniref:protein-serine/threonine phosphatase n=1 Tax=Reticulomyxa filosa TaxID=46433 RepID=X6NNQ2_RETFI|nr:hypothetical protein RFI_09492 [Reticulomyxa filosa]|eukprot:ETO27641.1 hypothetical protein RFI_09492 [Reticulomyxa filosa]
MSSFFKKKNKKESADTEENSVSLSNNNEGSSQVDTISGSGNDTSENKDETDTPSNATAVDTTKDTTASASTNGATQKAGGGADCDEMIKRLTEGKSNKSGKDAETIDESEIEKLCIQAREIFLQQPMLLGVEAPVKIVGDVHGQFSDLLRLFELGSAPPAASYIFLG